MANRLEIFNGALSLIGYDRYLSNPDSSFFEASTCRREYEAARREICEHRHWGWLRAETVPVAGQIARRGGGQWIMVPRPQDALTVIGGILDNGATVRARITMDGVIVESPDSFFRLAYIVDPDTIPLNDWPALFKQCVTLLLASRIAAPLEVDYQIILSIRQRASEMLATAALADARQEVYSGTDGKEYIRARRS